MPRLALALMLLAVGTIVRAEDDEQLLETPPAQGIPERMQELEREWAEDVGTKETDVETPEPTPMDEAHEAARGAEAEHETEIDTPPVPPHHDDVPAPKKSSGLESPLRRATPERPTVRGTPPPQPKEDAGAPEAPAKPAPRKATAAEE